MKKPGPVRIFPTYSGSHMAWRIRANGPHGDVLFSVDDPDGSLEEIVRVMTERYNFIADMQDKIGRSIVDEILAEENGTWQI